jgi:uncharacterized protein YcbK (DUF882 family)
MILYKNQDSQILKNFTEKELFCKSPDCPESHNFDNRLLIIQDIRDYYTKKGYDIKIHISSSFRTSLGNLLCGGAKNSMHLIGKALDFQIVGKDAAKVKSDYINQIKEKKYLFEKLRKGGISGMGIYPTFFHIDCRDESDNTALIPRISTENIPFGIISKIHLIWKLQGQGDLCYLFYLL